MSRRLYKRCLLWLLPVLVAQALVPVGFMVAAGDQGFALGFCPVQSARVVQIFSQLDSAATNQSSHAGHVGHHAQAANASDSSDSHDEQDRSGSCPYALTRTAIAHTPTAAIAALSLIQVDGLGPTVRLPILQDGPFAPNRIRGPPRPLSPIIGTF